MVTERAEGLRWTVHVKNHIRLYVWTRRVLAEQKISFNSGYEHNMPGVQNYLFWFSQNYALGGRRRPPVQISYMARGTQN